MSEPIIRKMEIDDLEESVALIRRVIIASNSKDYSENVIKNLLNHYSLSNFKNLYFKRNFYIALLGNRIVGTIAFEDDTVYSLFVDPAYQKKGIGRTLLKKIEEYIYNLGYNKAKLSASLTAVPFYKITGYIEKKRLRNYELGDVILMEKIISF